MSVEGTYSGDFEIDTPADRFIEVIVDDMSYEDKEFKGLVVENNSLTFSMDGLLISQSYKTIKTTITVTPKEDRTEGSLVDYLINFEKIRHDIDDPDFIVDLLTNYLKETDRFLKSIEEEESRSWSNPEIDSTRGVSIDLNFPHNSWDETPENNMVCYGFRD